MDWEMLIIAFVLCVIGNLLCECAGWHVATNQIELHAFRGGLVCIVVFIFLYVIRAVFAAGEG